MPSSDDQVSDVMFTQVVAGLDPVMVPLGFASGQGGVAGDAGQVIYCSAHPSGDGRCADVVLNLRRTDVWRIVAVSYDGFLDDHVEQLHLREDAGLPEQLESLRTSIPDDLNQWMTVMWVPSIRFRPLAESDLPTLVTWFAEPEIARWWNQPAEIDSVRTKYLPRIEECEPTRMWIAEIDGVGGGLLQSYRHADYTEHDECVGIAEAVGIDYLIAGLHRGRGLGRLVLHAFADWTLAHYPDASNCVATPAQANEASWRALEHAGFSRVGECQPPDEPLAYVYVRGREDGSTPNEM